MRITAVKVISDLDKAHKYSSRHRADLLRSDTCGCFHCLYTFPPSKITEWTDFPSGTPKEKHFDQGETALCPHCGIDSVLGSASGFPLTADFLQMMYDQWFK
jgi:hypothetical protein